MKNKGLLIVFTGCSGVGKGTIVKELLSRDSNCMLSVSATTRSPRVGETHGKEYFFITKDEFDKMIAQNGFLEYAEYCGNRYGTPKKAVEDMINAGKNVILEIEVQGGMQIKKICPDCVSIFITPPSIQELENRLRGRGTEDEATIQRRIAASAKELEIGKSYDYNVVNDNLEVAVQDVMNIINNERSKR